MLPNSQKLENGWLPRLPSIYQIETCSRCDLSCEFCLTGMGGVSQSKGLIETTLFEKIVERDLAGSHFIELQFRGEPTLNKDLPYFVDLLRYKVLVGFSTHGGLLGSKPHALNAALNCHYITISMDAGHKERYEQLRKGASWDKLMNGLNQLLLQRADRLYPVIDLQLIEFDGVNEEVEKVNELIKANWPDCYGKPNLRVRTVKDTQSGWRDNALIKDRTLCTNPWYSVSIKANGDVVPCCHAFEDSSIMTYGNLYDASLEEIWNSEKVKEFRQYHRYGPLPEPCTYCTAKSSHNFHQTLAFDLIKISTIQRRTI